MRERFSYKRARGLKDSFWREEKEEEEEEEEEDEEEEEGKKTVKGERKKKKKREAGNYLFNCYCLIYLYVNSEPALCESFYTQRTMYGPEPLHYKTTFGGSVRTRGIPLD